jgi:hypothetical protein
MKSTIPVLVCMVLLLTGLLSCQAPSNAWNGTWKLNVSKSGIPGPDFGITVSPMGEFYTDNGTSKDSFRCDGKEYSTHGARSLSCVQTNSGTLDTTSKANGVKTVVAHWELSPDQKTLTIESTRLQAAGPAKSQRIVYVRTAGSIGFAGAWRNPKRLESHPQTMVLILSEHSLRVAFPEVNQYTDLSLDGTDSILQTPGSTMAIHPNGPAEFLTTTKSAGQVVKQGSLTLSADRRTVTEVYWRSERPEERAVLVYERQ